MKRFVDIMKYVCAVGTAVLIYMTVSEAAGGTENLLGFILASLFAAGLDAALFGVSALLDRVSMLEDAVGLYVECGYEDEDDGTAKRECPVCHSLIDADSSVCPYCGDPSDTRPEAKEPFPTEREDYNGTDFSGEELVSAHFPDSGNGIR